MQIALAAILCGLIADSSHARPLGSASLAEAPTAVDVIDWHATNMAGYLSSPLILRFVLIGRPRPRWVLDLYPFFFFVDSDPWHYHTTSVSYSITM
jgi:hypothetical protein